MSSQTRALQTALRGGGGGQGRRGGRRETCEGWMSGVTGSGEGRGCLLGAGPLAWPLPRAEVPGDGSGCAGELWRGKPERSRGAGRSRGLASSPLLYYLFTHSSHTTVYLSQEPSRSSLDLFSTEQCFLAFISCCRDHVTGANAELAWQK